MLAIVLRKTQLLNDFLVALKDLNREEALLLLGEGMYGNLFNVCNRMLNHTAEAVLRDRLRVLGCMDSGFCCFLNAGALQSGNLNDLAAERLASALVSILSPFLFTTSIMLTATTTGIPSSTSWVVR